MNTKILSMAFLLLLAAPLAAQEKKIDEEAFLESAHGKLGCDICHPPRIALEREQLEADLLEPLYPGHGGAAAACMACHEREAEAYRESVHFRAIAAGAEEAPFCIDCHAPAREVPPGTGELESVRAARGDPHYIVASKGLQPPIQNGQVEKLCARCHENATMAEKYGLREDVVPTFRDSIHGRRNLLGSMDVPTCSSCHDNHGTLEMDNPASPVNPANVTETCRQCHVDATPAFSRTFRHERLTREQTPILYWLEKGYVLLLVAVVGFLYLHIFFDVITTIRLKLTGRLQRHSNLPLPPGTPKQIRRLSVNLRWQHVFLFSSTTLLIFTGWPLRIPDNPMAQGVVNFFGGADSIRVVHRVAAIVMGLACLWHFLYIAVRAVKRTADWSILPGPRDLLHVVQQFAFYFGLRDQRPRFGKFNYAQKMEYFAVVWGTLLMALTGIVLWSSWWSQTLPAWAHEASQIIHGYEALLAAIAVFGFHFYNEHIRYEVFPMSRVWITGSAPAEEYREEWAADFEERFGKSEAPVKEKEEEDEKDGEVPTEG